MKKHKHKSVIMMRILQSLRRLTAVFCMLLAASSVFTVGRTNAGFSDTEASTDNRFEAGSLDAVPTYIEYFDVVGMNPSQSPDARITLTNEGSLDYQYNVKFRKTSGDDLLCQSLHLVAERDGNSEYEGALSDFNLQGGLFTQVPFEEDNWDFTATLPADADSALENLSCEWHVDFIAWQTTVATPTEGFIDEESVGPHSIATGAWLTPGDVIINEVMWMGSSASTADEWIELKNMTGKAVSLAGWKIENASSAGDGTLTIPSGKSIPANGYFLIANYGSSNSSSALDVEAGWVTTTLELNNSDNGNLVLKAPSALTVDTALGLTDWPAGSNSSLHQSMERNDIPGDGTDPANWHTCVSGAANGAPYWDVTGLNFGTPLAANLSPIVMNEFVPNPVGDDDALMPEGEWIELYNILDTDIDVANWYFTNSDEGVITITADRTESGETLVPGQGTLVVYLGQSFLDNDADTLSLYDPKVLGVAEDDVREDIVSYEDVSLLPEGKSFARFPDGEGIWLDPEATPGESNVMTDDEKAFFQRLAFDACFVGEELQDDVADPMCSPIFLEFIDMVSDLEDDTIKSSVLFDILEAIQKEAAAELVALIEEDGVVTPEEAVLGDVAPIEEEAVTPETEEVTEEEVTEEVESDTNETTPSVVESTPTEGAEEGATETTATTTGEGSELVKDEEITWEIITEEVVLEEESVPAVLVTPLITTE